MLKYKIYFLFFIILISGCSINKFDFFYNSEGLSSDEYITSKKKERVLLVETKNLEQKLKEYEEKGYVVLGSSIFSGTWQSGYYAIKTAKKHGASVVLLYSVHQGDVNIQYTVPYTKANTTYHQGTIGNTSYSGTSTYYTTEYLHGSYKTSYYGQIALFLAKKR